MFINPLISAQNNLQQVKQDWNSDFNQTETLVCRKCGTTLDDFLHTGFVGCFECYKTFYPYLKDFAIQLNTSYEDVKANLKKNYDGYCFEETASVHVYNTWSVISFINGFNKNTSFPYKPYWSNTGAYSTLVMNFLKDI